MTNKEILESYGEYLHHWLNGFFGPLTYDKGAIRTLKKIMADISHVSIPIYRGLALRSDDVIKMLDGKSVNLLNRGLESWSTNPLVAVEFSMQSIHGYVNVIVSKQKPKKNTVVIDFTNKIVQNVVNNYMKAYEDEDDVVPYMKREKELVVTPQCDKCRLTDIEFLRLGPDPDQKLVDRFMRLKDFSLDLRQIITIQGKNKYKIFNYKRSMSNIPWKRKPGKS